MTNAQKFQETFGIYATEMWAMPEHDFLKWLNADTSQTEETCERCVYVRGSQWCQGCNGTPKRWDGEKIVDTPQTDCKNCTLELFDDDGNYIEPQTDNGIGCSRCESRYDCYDRNMPHAVRCNNYGKITDEP